MKVVSLYNFKGGVGKTSSCVNLAFESTVGGDVSLIWDLDPQGASSFYLNKKPKVKGGLDRFFSKKNALENSIKQTDFENLDMIPADLSFRNIEEKLKGRKKPVSTINKFLRQIERDYSRVFLDCPPRLTVTSENIFKASDLILVPVIPSALSQRAWEQVLEFASGAGYRVKKFRPFFTMVDMRRTLHRESMKTFRESFPGTLLTTIPYASEMEYMGVHRKPVQVFSGRSRSAIAYRALWQEVNQILNK